MGALLAAFGREPGTERCQAAQLTFQDFLGLISKVRASQQKYMKEELRPHFDKYLRRRPTGDALLGIKEIAGLLDELGMTPKNVSEQKSIQSFLEDANEWGFQPLALDFDAFVRFVRQCREWRSTLTNVAELE